ncbi:MAG: acyl-CoA dehydrogenase [Legionellales bacterium]|nr:acyl-CoA dehydrogenase [Legionellales bacterium]
MSLFLWILSLAALMVLACKRASIAVTTVGVGALLVLIAALSNLSFVSLTVMGLIFVVGALLFNLDKLRRSLITQPILRFYRRVQPKMSQTEKEAIAAGTVDWDSELFSGKPDWNKLLAYPPASLTEEERAFLDGPVEQLCHMLDDWEITHNLFDLPANIWQFLKENGFFSLIIPKEYGGKAFSAYAHSRVLIKVAGVSVTASTTISVPNSLGPAELILHYGTEEQKKYYLPRLACGDEIPCFALTGPIAGSDAGAMPDKGIICMGMFEGKEVLGIRLTWDKRYITLAPVATVLGLAFKLFDPEHLIGAQEELGITCALIPVSTPGVKIGRRHFPLNIAFQNGPTRGKNVFIPIDWIIGGVEMAGHGWRMLMECLATGRAISLPSTAIGGAKIAAATSGAYAQIRRQFKTQIGQFEGIQEVLAEIAGLNYIMDAAEVLTTSMIDAGQKPSVLSAIIKYHCTEMGRIVGNHSMDIHGGKGICLGPKNYLGRAYQGIPISITVEGANLLTRNMIIFGQGAIRCHPFALSEMEAASQTDPMTALAMFDKAIWGHIGFTLSNFVRSLVHGITGGRLLSTPSIICRRYFQLFGRMSASFALLADMSMLSIGADLKRREMVSARLGDILSYLYLGSAVLKRFDEQGRIYADLPVVEWCCQYLLNRIQQQMDALLRNYPKPILGLVLRFFVFPLGRNFAAPRDDLQKELATILQTPAATRDRLIEGLYLTDDGIHPAGRLNALLVKVKIAEPLFKLIHQAKKDGRIHSADSREQIQEALALALIHEDEADMLAKFEHEVAEIIAVDDFEPEELARVISLVDTEGNMVKALME